MGLLGPCGRAETAWLRGTATTGTHGNGRAFAHRFPHRSDADVRSTALRTAIGKARRATGTPLWSPHDLEHQRISLLHAQGRSWAEIAELVGNRSAKVLDDTYTHVLMDERELDYASLIDELLPPLAAVGQAYGSPGGNNLPSPPQ
jgi:integrase